MKSIQTGMIATSLAVGLLTLTPARILAQPTTTLNIALTATYQMPDTQNTAGTITTSTTKSVKFTSASILKLLATAANSGTAFPTGSYLAQNSGSVEVVTDKQGDSTAISQLTIDTSGAQVYSGSANSDTGKQSRTATTYTVATFDDGNGNAFTVDGLIKSTDSLTAPDKNGNQKETLSLSGTMIGYGTVSDGNGGSYTAVFTGTVSGSGSGSGS